MGVVKRTHPKARHNQLLRKYYRKHPEEYCSFLEDLRKQLSESMSSLADAIQGVVGAISKIAYELVEVIAAKHQQNLEEAKDEHRDTQTDPRPESLALPEPKV